MSTVLVEQRGPVRLVTLNRPERLNAVTDELVVELGEALRRDDGARAVVLTGSGRAFSSGHDLKHETGPETPAQARDRLERLQDLTRLIRSSPAPVIAAVEGWAVGAGCELTFACDLAVLAADARFRFPEVSLGLAVTNGVSQLLAAVAGPQRAKRLVLLGEVFDAQQVHAWGLASHLAEPGQALAGALALAEQLAALPAVATASAKALLDNGFGASLEEALAAEVEVSLALDPSERGRLPGPGGEG